MHDTQSWADSGVLAACVLGNPPGARDSQGRKSDEDLGVGGLTLLVTFFISGDRFFSFFPAGPLIFFCTILGTLCGTTRFK